MVRDSSHGMVLGEGERGGEGGGLQAQSSRDGKPCYEVEIEEKKMKTMLQRWLSSFSSVRESLKRKLSKIWREGVRRPI